MPIVNRYAHVRSSTDFQRLDHSAMPCLHTQFCVNVRQMFSTVPGATPRPTAISASGRPVITQASTRASRGVSPRARQQAVRRSRECSSNSRQWRSSGRMSKRTVRRQPGRSAHNGRQGRFGAPARNAASWPRSHGPTISGKRSAAAARRSSSSDEREGIK